MVTNLIFGRKVGSILKTFMSLNSGDIHMSLVKSSLQLPFSTFPLLPLTPAPGLLCGHRLWISVYWREILLLCAMAPHSSTLAWKIPWTEGPGRLQSMGSQKVGHDWVTSLSLFAFMHWRRKWQPTPVFLPGASQGWGSLWAAVYGVAQSRTRLKRLSSSSSSPVYICSVLLRYLPHLRSEIELQSVWLKYRPLNEMVWKYDHKQYVVIQITRYS